MGQLVGAAAGHRCVAREATILISLPEAREKLAHVGALSSAVPGNEPSMLGVFQAVQDGSRVVVYPGWWEVHCVQGGRVVPPVLVDVPSR